MPVHFILMAKQDSFTRYTIRVPGDLYERVQAAADASGRSVNAEITSALEKEYPPKEKYRPQRLRLSYCIERLKEAEEGGEPQAVTDKLREAVRIAMSALAEEVNRGKQAPPPPSDD